MLPLALPFAACQTIVTTAPADCSGFIPQRWAEPIKGYPLPPLELVGDVVEWQKFGVGQSGQLAKANGMKEDIVHIFSECERRMNEARPRKKFLGIF